MKTTDWLTAHELAQVLSISFKTVRSRAGNIVDGLRYEERDVTARDQVHWKTKTLFRVVPVDNVYSFPGSGQTVEPPAPQPPPRTLEKLPELDLAGKLRWSESRRSELVDANNGLRKRIVMLEQQVDDLSADYQAALQEKRASGGAELLEAMLSALGGVGEDDMREILSQAVRDHFARE